MRRRSTHLFLGLLILGIFGPLALIAELRYTPSTHWVFGVRVPKLQDARR